MDHADRRRRRVPGLGGIMAWALAAAAAIGMSGCFTGERPTLASERSTGSAAVDALVDRIIGLGDAVYTADYDVVPSFTNQPTVVRASQSGASRRSVTIGDVRYLIDGSTARTCTVSTGQCSNGIDPARVSDVQMSPDFFGTSLLARLRHDAEIATSEPTASSEQIEGETATCVTIPVADGATTTYCVLDNGVLARLDAGDLDVTMTGYEPGADAALFTPDES